MPDQYDSKAATSDSASPNRAIRFLPIFSIASCGVVIATMGCCVLTTFVMGLKKFESPKEAEEVAARITQWTLPPGFEGKSGLVMENPFFKVDLARFVQNQGRGQICLGQIRSPLSPFYDQRAELEQLIETATPELKVLKVDQCGCQKMTIRNLPAEFQIEHGEDQASTTRLVQVTGYFRGLRDDALLILQCEEGILTDEQIDQFIKSIK